MRGTKVRWRALAAVALLGSAAAACSDSVTAPAGAARGPNAPRLDGLPGDPCAVAGSGTYCGVTVSFSAFYQPTAFGHGFQTSAGTGSQGPITVTFSQDVGSVTVTALDPDYSGNYMAAYNASGVEIGRVYFQGDGTPGVYTTSTKTLYAAGIRSVKLVSDPSDYTPWDNLSFAQACTVNAPGTACNIVVGISPYYAPTPRNEGFQSNSTTGWQEPITVTFSGTVGSVTVTAEDPDYSGNYMAAYNSAGTEIGRVYFQGDGIPGWNNYTTDTRTIVAPGIASVKLVSDPSDYTAWENVTFVRDGSPTPAAVSASISGTDDVLSAGTYTWTANATGGNGSYTYLWEYQPDGSSTWTSVGTSATYSRYVSATAPNFTLRLTVASNGSSASSTLYVYNESGTSTCSGVRHGRSAAVPIQPC